MCVFVCEWGEEGEGKENGKDRGTEENGLEGISHEKQWRVEQELELSERSRWSETELKEANKNVDRF